AEDRREMEDHGFSYVALVSLDVCRTRSAANEQNKIFRTVPAQMNFLHDGRGHISIHDLSNDLRSPLAIDPQRLGNLVPDGLDCSILIQPYPAAKIIFGVDVAKHDIRIRNGRFFSSTFPAGRPRHRDSASRSDLHLI